MLDPQPIPISERELPAFVCAGGFLPFLAGALELELLWPLISKVCANATPPPNSKQPAKMRVRLANIP
jgi:hypothetical protein